MKYKSIPKTKSGKIENTKDDLYWRLNIQPNYNETWTQFIYKLLLKLLTEKEALIVINKDQTKSKYLYVADDFEASTSILYGKTYSKVILSDNNGNSLAMEKIYTQEDAIYYSIKNQELTLASENFKTNTAKILKAAQKSFIKHNIPKWRLKLPGNQPKMIDPSTNEPIDYSKYKEKITEGINNDEESIVMLADAFDLIDLNKEANKKTDDLSSSLKIICDGVAQKWNIPLDIFYGSKTEKSTGNSDFITFAVSQYFELLEDGFNAVLVGKKDYLKGEYITFNKFNITHKDIIDSANGIDKLRADGFSRNEINMLLGLPRIDESWADEHYITKNYEIVEGGEE